MIGERKKEIRCKISPFYLWCTPRNPSGNSDAAPHPIPIHIYVRYVHTNVTGCAIFHLQLTLIRHSLITYFAIPPFPLTTPCSGSRFEVIHLLFSIQSQSEWFFLLIDVSVRELYVVHFSWATCSQCNNRSMFHTEKKEMLFNRGSLSPPWSHASSLC